MEKRTVVVGALATLIGVGLLAGGGSTHRQAPTAAAIDPNDFTNPLTEPVLPVGAGDRLDPAWVRGR